MRIRTDNDVRRAPVGDHGCGGNGLILRVRKSGSRSFVQRVMVQGRRTDVGLGGYPAVTLAQAKEAAIDNRRIARAGEDPRRPQCPSFEQAAAHSFAKRTDEWRAGCDGQTARAWQQRMADHVLPRIGPMPVDKVGTNGIESVLRPLALKGQRPLAETVSSHITQVLRDAYLAQWRGDDGADPVRAVVSSLPKRKAAVKHARALHWATMPDAMTAIAARPAKGASEAIRRAGQSLRLAFAFMTLTAARQNEVRQATWDQFSGGDAEGIWTKPAAKTKAGIEHRVPLSTQAVNVLRAARKLNPDSDLVFPGSRGLLGTSSMRQLLALCEIEADPHGSRSTFRVWAQETGVDRELAKRCLAHAVGDATDQAYARSDVIERRRKVLQAYADAIAPIA